jgi:hypothetical protein
MTVVHDAERQCYIHLGKSSRSYDSVKCELNQKKTAKKADMLYGYSYYKVDDNKTRYIHVFLMSQQKGTPEALLKYATLSRGKSVHEGYHKVINEMTKRNWEMDLTLSPYNTLCDFREMYEANGNSKTWIVEK